MLGHNHCTCCAPSCQAQEDTGTVFNIEIWRNMESYYTYGLYQISISSTIISKTSQAASFLALWAQAWLRILGFVFNLGPKLSNGGDILSLLQKRLTEVLTDRDWTWAWQQLNIMLQHNQQLLWCVVWKWIRMFNSLDIESSRGNLKLKHVIECYKKEVVWKCSKLMVWKCSNYVTKSGCLRVIQFVKLNKN